MEDTCQRRIQKALCDICVYLQTQYPQAYDSENDVAFSLCLSTRIRYHVALGVVLEHTHSCHRSQVSLSSSAHGSKDTIVVFDGPADYAALQSPVP